MSEFKIGDRVIMCHPDLWPMGVAGRVVGHWLSGQHPLVKVGGLSAWHQAAPWHSYPRELTLAPSRMAAE